MPRPPAELRRLEDEERRRALAHRRLRRDRRLRTWLWVLGGTVLLVALALFARLAALFLG